MPDARTPSIVALMGSRSLFGAERANIDLLRMMQATGARVTCLVRDEEWPENFQLRRFLQVNGLEWRTCPFASYPTWRYLRYWRNLIFENFKALTEGSRRIELICQEVGATHIHSFNPFMTFSFFPFLYRSEISLIYRCGESPIIHNFIFRMIWLWLRRRINLIGTESKYLESLLIECGFEQEKILVIRTPPPHRPPSSNSNKFIKFQNKMENAIRFLFIGQIEKFKGVEILLESFDIVWKNFPDSRLLLAGPLESDWSKMILASANHNFPAGVVSFLGHTEEVPNLLEQCDVHVAPSLKPEGYGLVAVEAKQAERPSIVFEGGGLGELIAHDVDGIIVGAKTADALAEAMLSYCREPKRVLDHGRAAKASLTERLGTDRYAEEWRAMYDHTMPNP